jgi:hypothetical protein
MATKKIFLTIYLFTLMFRLFRLPDTAVYPDEITWTVRGKEIVYSLIKGQWSYLDHAWWNDKKEGQALGFPITVLGGISHVFLAGDGKYSLKLLSDITAARLPAVLLHSLLPPCIFYFLSKLSHPRLGTLVAIAYSINPIAIGLDRWLIHDSSLALFSFLAISQYYLDTLFQKNTIWPGFFLGLAILTKPNGILPLLAWLIITFSYKNYHALIKNILVSALSIIIIWPGSWKLPGYSLLEYYLRQTKFAQIPQAHYFMGSPTFVLPIYYYPFQLLARTPELILVGLILGLVFRPTPHRSFQQAVIVYCLAFLGFIAFSLLKNGYRYLYPILPWIYISSFLGMRKLLPSKLFRSLLFTTLLMTLIYFPNSYSLYYNHFVIGPQTAKKLDLVGLCLGNKAAFTYMSNHHLSGTVAVLGCSDTANYHTKLPLTKDWTTAKYIVLESAHYQLFPNIPSVQSLTTRNLIAVIEEQGVETARVYQ